MAISENVAALKQSPLAVEMDGVAVRRDHVAQLQLALEPGAHRADLHRHQCGKGVVAGALQRFAAGDAGFQPVYGLDICLRESTSEELTLDCEDLSPLWGGGDLSPVACECTWA